MPNPLLNRSGRWSAFIGVVWAVVALAGCATAPAVTAADRLTTAPLHRVTTAIAEGEVTAEQMVGAYLARIERLDRAGPRLQSVLTLNPKAVEEAKALDAERAAGRLRGPLHGVPVLIKDNIETLDPMPTTAGSLALADNYTQRDAPLAAGLRSAGAIILGKTNLSEWANFRSEQSISGWSGLGGQVRNPHILDRSPCGSSSGSGAAAAASLAAGTVGTETNGSIICPSSMNGVVGFKPTVGLVSQAQIVPISSSQDTAGPMTRTVRDAAIMLRAMTGRPDAPDYAAGLSSYALQGRRIGVLRFAVGRRPDIQTLFEEALATLRSAGATLVDIETYERPPKLWPDQFKVLKAEFKATINAYLASTPPAVTARTLTELIQFNTRVAERELVLFDQGTFEEADGEPPLSDAAYTEALARIQTATRQDGIDKMMKEFDVAILVAPSAPPAFPIDPVHGDSYPGGTGAGYIAAIAGYPHLTVPMGRARGLPVGLSFMSTAGKDAEVLAAGYAYEQRRGALAPPAFLRTAEEAPTIRAMMARPVSTATAAVAAP